MKTNDYYIAAVAAWQAANKNLKHFAQCCAQVSDLETAALAADCKCSPDTIERYRRAWWLYQEMGGGLPNGSDGIDALWESAGIGLWVKAARLRTTLEIPLPKIREYLETANAEGMTREQFAANVDAAENKRPVWERVLLSMVERLSKPAWISKMPEDKRARYEKALAWFAAELQAITEGEAV